MNAWCLDLLVDLVDYYGENSTHNIRFSIVSLDEFSYTSSGFLTIWILTTIENWSLRWPGYKGSYSVSSHSVLQ